MKSNLQATHEEEFENFCYNVVLLQHKYQLSDKQMQRQFQISAAQWSSIKAGKMPNIGGKNFLAICSFFRYSPSKLLSGRL